MNALPPFTDRQAGMSRGEGPAPAAVKPVEAPVQRERPFLADLPGGSRLVRIHEARHLFRVDGAGTTVALLDTGLRTTHRDFAGRVAAQRNFTGEHGGDPSDASDGHGHGTSVAGMLCAGGIHCGMAPAARIVPLKVLDDQGSGRFRDIAEALQWVIENHRAHEISAVCLALGDGANHGSDWAFADDPVAGRIKSLAALRIPCCIAAGDDYFTHGSAQGMSFPAIVRDALSVGAVYSGDVGPLPHPSGAEAYETAPDRITAFSQRLHEKVGRECATQIFAPGAPMISSGILSDEGVSIQHGTSQATPIVAGLVLLLQSLHKRATGELPAVADLRRWLTGSAATITDSDEEHDNVLHTGLAFRRLDAVAALECCAAEIARSALAAGDARRPRPGPPGAFIGGGQKS